MGASKGRAPAAESRIPARIVAAVRNQMLPHDELMLEAGAVGELLVARIRVAAVTLIFLMPIVAWASGAPTIEVVNGALVSVLALLFSLGLFWMARRGSISLSLRLVSTAFDVTSISSVLVLFLWHDLPHTAVNSRVVWELYLIAIAATALRGDPRICLFAGALSVTHYALIIFAATELFGDLNDDRFAPFAYGFFNWGDQISRLIILGLATMMALAAVLQTRKLLRLSSVDQLTGARNRAYLDLRLHRSLLESRARGTPLSLAMIDADEFKQFNDRHGHLAGDDALATIVARLRATLESGEAFVARYGGEEFTAVFPGLTVAEAAAHCDRARAAVAATRIDRREARSLPCPTISAGLAELRPGMTAQELVDRADRALAAAKNKGRDRIEIECAD